MPKQHSSADKRLGRDFKKQLRNLLGQPGISKKKVALSLKLTGQGLDDLLKKTTVPTLRTVALAVDRYGFSFRYPDTTCRIERESPRLDSSDARQLVLPLVLTTTAGEASIKIGSQSVKSIEFEIAVKQA